MSGVGRKPKIPGNVRVVLRRMVSERDEADPKVVRMLELARMNDGRVDILDILGSRGNVTTLYVAISFEAGQSQRWRASHLRTCAILYENNIASMKVTASAVDTFNRDSVPDSNFRSALSGWGSNAAPKGEGCCGCQVSSTSMDRNQYSYTQDPKSKSSI